MPVVPNMIDVQQMPLYDTFTLATGTATPAPIQFFTDPISSTKGRTKTNLNRGAQLESPKSFFIRAMRFFFSPDVAIADITSFYKGYIAVLIIGEKEYQIGGLEFFPGGAGMYGQFGTMTAAAANYFIANGSPDPRGINVLDPDKGIPIQQGENFRVELQGTTFNSTAAIWLRCYLDGFIGRQVQ